MERGEGRGWRKGGEGETVGTQERTNIIVDLIPRDSRSKITFV